MFHLMKYVKTKAFIVLVGLTLILIPSFAVISSSQSNDTVSDDTSSNQTFASISRDLAENQSEGQSTSSDDEGDQADN
jgi:hypothetical protein